MTQEGAASNRRSVSKATLLILLLSMGFKSVTILAQGRDIFESIGYLFGFALVLSLITWILISSVDSNNAYQRFTANIVLCGIALLITGSSMSSILLWFRSTESSKPKSSSSEAKLFQRHDNSDLSKDSFLQELHRLKASEPGPDALAAGLFIAHLEDIAKENKAWEESADRIRMFDIEHLISKEDFESWLKLCKDYEGRSRAQLNTALTYLEATRTALLPAGSENAVAKKILRSIEMRDAKSGTSKADHYSMHVEMGRTLKRMIEFLEEARPTWNSETRRPKFKDPLEQEKFSKLALELFNYNDSIERSYKELLEPGKTHKDSDQKGSSF